MDYIYLRVGRVRLREGGACFKADLNFFARSAMGWGGKNKFERKRRGVKANFFFL